jgi:hypothetical protein
LSASGELKLADTSLVLGYVAIVAIRRYLSV